MPQAIVKPVALDNGNEKGREVALFLMVRLLTTINRYPEYTIINAMSLID